MGGLPNEPTRSPRTPNRGVVNRRPQQGVVRVWYFDNSIMWFGLRRFALSGETCRHIGYDVIIYFRSEVIGGKPSKIPPPTALRGISRERFKLGSWNFTLLSRTTGPTNLPEMTSLAASGWLQNVIWLLVHGLTISDGVSVNNKISAQVLPTVTELFDDADEAFCRRVISNLNMYCSRTCLVAFLSVTKKIAGRPHMHHSQDCPSLWPRLSN